MNQGIYCIKCAHTNKTYVGSATNIKKRWWRHRKDLREKKHHNKYLQRAWNKYGEGAFSFDILEWVKSKYNLKTREQYWIDTLNSHHSANGFNECKEAYTTAGRPCSERCKNLKAKEWTVKPPNGTEFTIKNLNAFCYKTQLNRGCMKNVAQGIANHHKGWCCRKGDMNHEEWQQLRELHQLKKCRKCLFTSPTGEQYVEIGLGAFCRKHALTVPLMRAVAIGKQRHHKGWHCQYL